MRVAKVIQALILAQVLIVSGAAAQVPIETLPFWQSIEENVYSTGMIWRDCDNDGFIDLFISNGNDMALAPNVVYISKCGTLPDAGSWYSSNSEYSGHCTVGDVDGNGFPDLAVSNFIRPGWLPASSNMYLNPNGMLNSNPDWITASYGHTFSCAFGDPDGDGDLDLAMATGMSYGGPAQYDCIYFNIDAVLQTAPGWQSGIATEAMDVFWGDVDNDGDLDLAFCYDDFGAGVHYNNAGNVETTPSWMSMLADPANTVIFGDVNGDDWLDLVVAFNYQNGGRGYYSVYYNDGTGNLETYPGWNSSTGGYGSAVSMYDYDNDGDEDLAAGRWWDRPRVYENLGDSFTSAPVWQADLSTVVEELAWIDVDGDGVEARADTFYTVGDRKLFYTSRHPLQAIDSVAADGIVLADGDYCYELISGWVSLGQEPDDSIIIFYQYSFKNDLAVSNWDTYNLAYGNTNEPYVKFYADTNSGFVPLTVQFSDSSLGASDWLWRFDDGDSALIQNPAHTFLDGGTFDIYLENVLPDGWHNRTIRKMIIALADTIYFPEITSVPGDTVKLPIYMKNCHTMYNLILPFYYGGPVQLSYLGFDTDSCRTDYFDQVKLIAMSPADRKMTFSFKPSISSDNPPLEPGYGRLINVYFLYQSGSGTNVLDSTTLSSRTLRFDADYLVFQPYVVTGYVSSSYIVRGDANGDMAINLLDVTFLIRYLYKGGPAPDPYAGDVNSDGSINLLDIMYLINYLYKGGPPPLL